MELFWNIWNLLWEYEALLFFLVGVVLFVVIRLTGLVRWVKRKLKSNPADGQ